MAISNYTKPQLTIRQLLDRIQASTVPRLATVVLAPKYILNRYGEETNPTAAFTGSAQTLSWTYYDEDDALQTLGAGYLVDLDSVRLYGVGLEATLTTYTSATTNKVFLNSLADPTVIKINNSKHFNGSTLEATLYGRPVAVGDIVYVNDGVSGVKRRTVTELIGATVAASYGTNNAKDNEAMSNSTYNPTTAGAASVTYVSAPAGKSLAVDDETLFNATVRGSSLNGLYGEEFTVTVRTGGAPATATVDISSKSGLWAASNVATVNDSGDYAITSAELAGLSVTITAATLIAGEKFVFQVFQEYTRLTSTHLVLDDDGDKYTGPVDTTYIIQVTTGTTGDTFAGAVLRIYDTAGLETATSVTVVNDTFFDLGSYGLKAKFVNPVSWAGIPQGGARAGDIYYVHAKAQTASTTDFDKVRLDGAAADTALFTNIATALTAEFRLPFTGQILASDAADGEAWTADQDGLDVQASLAMYVSDRTSNKWASYVSTVGTLAAHWRATVPTSNAEGLQSIETTDDIITKAGTLALENDAAFALNEALAGAQDRRIYFVNTGGVTVEDFTVALRKISNTDIVSFIGVCSDDPEVQQAVSQHCTALSAENRMRFRRCYIGVDSPGEYETLGLQDNDTPHTATINPVGVGGANLSVVFATDVDLTALTIESGDKLRLTADPDNVVEYLIDSVISPTELRLQSGPALPASPAIPVQIWRQDSASSQATYVRNRAKSFADRRTIVVWQESGSRVLSGTTATVIPNRFLACHVAGLRSALLPQQGLTRTEIESITAAPSMYNKYDEDKLDLIAADGVFIITQEYEDGAIFVRHQLTTDVNNGLLYYEDSMGVAADAVAFQVKDVLGGYVGRRNVTTATLAEMQSVIEDVLVEASRVPLDAEYGPLIEGFEDLAVTRNATMADTVDVVYTLLQGPPMNRIRVTQRSTIAL